MKRIPAIGEPKVLWRGGSVDGQCCCCCQFCYLAVLLLLLLSSCCC
jgi:hypothetical protein